MLLLLLFVFYNLLNIIEALAFVRIFVKLSFGSLCFSQVGLVARIYKNATTELTWIKIKNAFYTHYKFAWKQSENTALRYSQTGCLGLRSNVIGVFSPD